MPRHLIFALIIAAILSCGRNDPLSTYEPKSPQEQALKSIFLDFQDGVNTRNSRKVENILHEKAALMTGRERKILSRAEYIKILPKRLADNPPISLGIPKMEISGDLAEVRIYLTRGGYTVLVVYDMKMVNNKWYIKNWKY